MMSFIGCMNNVTIKFQIYFTSHMLIVRQVETSFLSDFMYLYRAMVYTNIKKVRFVSLHILFVWKKYLR
jgi:hypothetical protein